MNGLLRIIVNSSNLSKALGDIRGVTYIYAMFYRFGLINVPEKAKEKMEPVRNKDTEQMSFV